MSQYFPALFKRIHNHIRSAEGNVDNILLFNFCEQKFVQHVPITIAIDCNCLSLLIFEEKWPNCNNNTGKYCDFTFYDFGKKKSSFQMKLILILAGM